MIMVYSDDVPLFMLALFKYKNSFDNQDMWQQSQFGQCSAERYKVSVVILVTTEPTNIKNNTHFISQFFKD